MSRLSSTTLLFVALAALAACAADPTADHGAPGSLRAAVFAHYDELVASHALPHANGAGSADFSGVVGPFLPPGTPVADAIALLARNGFVVHASPSGHDGLAAELLVAGWALVGRADVSCTFAAPAAGGGIGALRCALYVGML